MESTLDRVKKVLVEQLDVDAAAIEPEASIVDDLGADSLDIVEIIMGLEDQFDVEIPDEDAEKITTVQQIIDYVENKGNATPSAPTSVAAETKGNEKDLTAPKSSPTEQ